MHLERAYCVWSILWLYKAVSEAKSGYTSACVFVGGICASAVKVPKSEAHAIPKYFVFLNTNTLIAAPQCLHVNQVV